MWKPQLIALLSLAACDGLNTFETSPTTSDPNAPLTLSSAVGKTYVPAGPTMITANGFDVVGDRSATIQVVSSKQINVNGVPLQADATGTTFRSADGTYVMQVASSIDGVSTDQILYMLASEQVGGQSLATAYVMGNATPASGIPTSGTAVYTGKMTVVDDLGNAQTMAGPVLVVSLDTAAVNGSFSFAQTTVSLAQTKMSNGSFLTTVSSAEAQPIVTGTIDGTMFGATGQEIGGTVGLQYNPNGTPNQSYIGYYGATTTP